MFGIPADQISNLLLQGTTATLTDCLRAYAEAGAGRVVVSIAAGDWFRQTALIAEALRQLSSTTTAWH